MPTRTIFFQISPASKAVFNLLAAFSVGVCCYGLYRRWRLWQQGRPSPPIRDWPKRLRALLTQVIGQRRVLRRRYAGPMHLLLFYGMLALFLGTVIVAIEHYGAPLFGSPWFYKGAFYLACKTLLDLFGLGLLIAVGMALSRRYLARPLSLGHEWKDGLFLLLLFLATLTGFTLEGAGLAADPSRAPYAAFSPVGRLFALPMAGITPGGYVVMWWLHIPFVLGVIAVMPYCRWLHLFVIPPTILAQPDRPMGALEPLRIEQVDETGRVGLGTLADIDRWTLMSLDACMECGRCADACPARAVGKELNPKQVVLDLRRLMEEGGQAARYSGSQEDLALNTSDRNTQTPEHRNTDIISDDSLWACTNCHACVRECPALIRHVDILDGIRRYRVAEGRLTGTPAAMLRQLGSRENPWGLPASQRLDWAKGLEIPAAAASDGREVLLWVGCAGAFDPRGQKTARALAELLQKAGVKFAVLGPKERCNGDPARRVGDEFLFQQLAEANIATLDSIGAQQIVTPCPHCFHTLKNEYPQFDGNYEVQHHTQFLAQLVEAGRLALAPEFAGRVTYHDPCFLARVNRETQAPRRLLNGAMPIPLTELERREDRTFCCGAGGGRMWMEEPANQRPGNERARELIAAGAETVAVGCYFCKVMVGDSLAQVGGESAPSVLDVAEVLLAASTAAQPQILQEE
jgi:Fe-S oxidoreductase